MASSPTARATPSADVPRVASVAGGAPAARAEVMEPVAVNEALERALTVSNNEWADCAEVIRDLDPELATVPFAPAEFSMLMLSFVVHAAQAVAADVARSGGRGQIRVGTRASGRWAEIRIGDSASSPPETLRTGALETGIGLERVTDRSWQWLLLAHQVITQRHGGTMRLEARAGLGATFVIRLPA